MPLADILCAKQTLLNVNSNGAQDSLINLSGEQPKASGTTVENRKI